MAEETVPIYVAGSLRYASEAIAGKPQVHVLHNSSGIHPGANVGTPLWQLPPAGGHLSFAEFTGPSPIHQGLLPTSRSRDFWGYGFIAGKVTIEGDPVSRTVRLFDVRTGLLLRQQWSEDDGNYRFDWLDPSRDYFVLAHDFVQQFNAVIADHIVPETTRYP